MVLVRVRTVKRQGMAVEFSGTVEGLGEKVTAFRVGDEVHGIADDVFAEYVCVRCGSIRLANHD